MPQGAKGIEKMYKKLYDGTVVTFQNLGEVRLDKTNCLVAINNIRANRDDYATEKAFAKQLSLYIGAARFMGWLDAELVYSAPEEQKTLSAQDKTMKRRIKAGILMLVVTGIFGAFVYALLNMGG